MEELKPILIAEFGDIRRCKNAGSLMVYTGIDAPTYDFRQFIGIFLKEVINI